MESVDRFYDHLESVPLTTLKKLESFLKAVYDREVMAMLDAKLSEPLQYARGRANLALELLTITRAAIARRIEED